MLKSYRVRLYPNKEQRELLEKHFGCSRWVYNWALQKKIEGYAAQKKTISRFSLSSELPELKSNPETAWLSDVNAQSLQAALRNLEEAYTKFFRQKCGFPKFKSKRGRQRFQCPQHAQMDFVGGRISLPKIKPIKIAGAKPFEGKIKTVTVSRSPSGKYFASILVDDEKKEPIPKARILASNTIGVDLGLTHFATLSTGEKIDNPRFLKWNQRKLRRSQRSLSRKKKGSSNREKCRKKVAIIYERISNQSRDFQHKLSTRLIRENQAVALETLNVSGMQKNSRLANAISDAAWSQFVFMLEYKARWNGKTVLRIGRFEPSSKLCSCGVINSGLLLGQRKWTCANCGTCHDRDVLAANNIKRMALNPKNFLAQGMREFKPVEGRVSDPVKQEWKS